MSAAEEPTLEGERLLQFWDGWLTANQMQGISMAALARGEFVLGTMHELGIHDADILEIGCANGWFSRRLAQHGRVTGIDISPAGIEAARQLLPAAEFVAGDFLELDFGSDRFDLVVCLECLAYVSSQPRFFELVERSLRPGGYLILTTPNWPLFESQGMERKTPSTLAARHLDMNSLSRLARPYLQIRTLTSILPTGHRGICRISNSPKLNALLGLFMSARKIDAIKGRLRLGQSLYLVARKA